MLSSQWKMRSYKRSSTQSETPRTLTNSFSTNLPILYLNSFIRSHAYSDFLCSVHGHKRSSFHKWQPWLASRRGIILSPSTKVGLLTCDVFGRQFLMTALCRLPFLNRSSGWECWVYDSLWQSQPSQRKDQPTVIQHLAYPWPQTKPPEKLANTTNKSCFNQLSQRKIKPWARSVCFWRVLK